MNDDHSIIETHDLTKQFKNITAVDGLNLSVQRGEVSGLLGPDGAGKITTIIGGMDGRRAECDL